MWAQFSLKYLLGLSESIIVVQCRRVMWMLVACVFHTGGEDVGVNPKISNMLQGYLVAKYDVLWISDSGCLGVYSRHTDSQHTHTHTHTQTHTGTYAHTHSYHCSVTFGSLAATYVQLFHFSYIKVIHTILALEILKVFLSLFP